MEDLSNKLWDKPHNNQLVQVLTAIDDPKVMRKFLRDAMTQKEISEIAARLEAARMLTAGNTYVDVIQKTKLSSRTIARISAWLQKGTGGYVAAFAIIKNQNDAK